MSQLLEKGKGSVKKIAAFSIALLGAAIFLVLRSDVDTPVQDNGVGSIFFKSDRAFADVPASSGDGSDGGGGGGDGGGDGGGGDGGCSG